MTHFYMRRDVYKSGGNSASQRVAYITRQPVQRHAEQQLRYMSEGREDCLYTTSRNLPAWCAGNPHVYFAAAERYEGAGWVAFEELKIGLPVELSHGQNMDLMRDLVGAIAGDTLPITYAFHAPRTMDDTQEQPHLHLILSRRQTDTYDRGPARHFRRYNAAHPERGGAQKEKTFAERLAQRHLRVMVSDVVNLHLERAGCHERVHPASLERRGIDRQPEPKLRPSESRAYREEGKVSPRMQEVLESRAQRQHTRVQEQADARAYWIERKDTLGITAAMDTPAQLAAICEARTRVKERGPVQQVAERIAGVERDDHVLGDLAGEAVAQAQQEAHGMWVDAQAEQRLRGVGDEAVRVIRQAAHEVWHDVYAEHTLRDIGISVVHTAMNEVHDAWADTQEEQGLRDSGWEAVRAAWDEGQSALAGVREAQQAKEQVRAGQSLEQELQDLARQLDALREDDGGTGHVRVHLWDREQGRGL